MMNFVLVASVGVALATNQHHTNQHHQGQTWQFKYPDRPKSSKNSVIAAFYKDGTCSGPVTVVNTAGECLSLIVRWTTWSDYTDPRTD